MTVGSVHADRLQSRCDRCGAAAKYQVLVGKCTGFDVLLCTHHYNEHGRLLEDNSGRYAVMPFLSAAEAAKA